MKPLCSAPRRSPGPADVEVAHGDLHAGTEVRELFEGLKALARFCRKGAQRRRHEVAEGLAVGAPDPSPQLVQVAEPKLVRLVDQNRVRVRDVDAAFDDGGRHQHVEGAVDEARHHVLEVFALHLAVADANARVGHEALDHARDFLDVAHAVVDEVRLASTAEFVGDGITDDFFVEARDDGVDGVPVGRRGADDAQVARAHQGELERPGNRRGGEGQGVDVGLERLEFVLDAHPKLLFLVNHQQAQVLEFDALADEGVRADQDVHLARLHALQGLGQRFARLEAVDVLHGDGELAQASAEALEVLHRQDGRRHEHGHLFAVACRTEGRPNRDFRLPEAHISAHEAVHGCGLEHVFAHGLCGGVLVGGVFVHEARLQRVLQVAVFRIGVARGGFALGVELQEVVGDLLDTALGLLLGLGPGVGAELVDFGLGAFLAAVLRDAVQAVDAHVEHVPAAVGEADGLLHLSVDFDFVESAEFPDAVVDVDHKIAHFQRHQLLDGERFFVLPEPFLEAEAVVALEQLVVGVDQNLELLVHKALAQLHRNGLVRHRFFPFFEAVVEDVVQALELGRLAADDHVDVAAFVVRTQVGRDEVKLLVERRLRRHPVLENHAVGPRRAAAKLHHAERVEQALQGFACKEQFVGGVRLTSPLNRS